MKKNYMIDVAFTVEGEWKDFSNIPTEEIIKGLEKRLEFLKENKDDAAEAFGLCDSYDVE